MRKIVSAVLALMLALSALPALAQTDISALSYEELLSLQDDVSRALRAVEPVNGSLIYELIGVRVFFMGMVNEYGPAAQFQIENACKSDIIITFEDVAINDFMMNTLFMCTVNSGKKAIDNMGLLYLDDYKIDEVSKIDLTVKMLDADTYNEVDVSDNITLIP